MVEENNDFDKHMHAYLFNKFIQPFINLQILAKPAETISVLDRLGIKYVTTVSPVFSNRSWESVPIFINNNNVSVYNWIDQNNDWEDIRDFMLNTPDFSDILSLCVAITAGSLILYYYWIDLNKKDKPQTYEEYLEQEQIPLNCLKMYFV